MMRSSFFSAMLFGLGMLPAALAEQDAFTTIDYPGASATAAYGINNAGDVVGYYTGEGNLNHGFLFSGGKFTSIDYPGARQTWARGINARGDIVGNWGDGTRNFGFLLRQGVYTLVDCPGSISSWATDINSAGDIAGIHWRAVYPAQGFMLSGGACSLSEYRPESASTNMTMYFGINDAGVLVGHWGSRAAIYAIALNKGTFTQFAHGGGNGAEALGINNAGDMVGDYRDGDLGLHGFLLKNGRFTAVDVPGARSTTAFKINNSGQVAGSYVDAGNKTHGFVARVTPDAPPAPLLTVDDDGADCPGGLRTIQEAVARAVPGCDHPGLPRHLPRDRQHRGPGKDRPETDRHRPGRRGGPARRLHRAGRLPPGEREQRSDPRLHRPGFRQQGDHGQRVGRRQPDLPGKRPLQHHRAQPADQRRHDGHHADGLRQQHRPAKRGLSTDSRTWPTAASTSQGAKSAGNIFRLNMTWGNKIAGIMIAERVPATGYVADNTVVSNGRVGIDVQNTSEIRIEGQPRQLQPGYWGDVTSAAASCRALGST